MMHKALSLVVELGKVICPHLNFKKGGAIDKDYRVTKQQNTTLFSFYGIEGGRNTSCMACKKMIHNVIHNFIEN